MTDKESKIESLLTWIDNLYGYEDCETDENWLKHTDENWLIEGAKSIKAKYVYAFQFADDDMPRNAFTRNGKVAYLNTRLIEKIKQVEGHQDR
jgi:hypothetical protein